MIRFVCVVLLSGLLPALAWAEARLALVIGNDAYDEVPVLQKAVSDATSVADALAAQGFEVVVAKDAGRREMNRTISAFTGRLKRGDTAFVFFAGHGVEIDGENYLLPTDIIAPQAGERDFIKSESIALSDLLDRVRATGARTTLAVIDACRDNPFETVSGRSIGRSRGLGRITAPEGTFVIFSAGAGQLALDRLEDNDPNPNSVFTRKLLPKLAQPGLELRQMMADLRVEVRDLALTQGHQQFPAYYDELLGEFYFQPAAAVAPEVVAVPEEPAAEDDIRRDFDLAAGIGSPAALQAFLDRYGDRENDFTVGLARSLLAEKLAAAAPAEAERALVVAPEPEPAPEPVESAVVAPEAPVRDRREIVRATQAFLNTRDCEAGTADGVDGPRTRRAFEAFVEEAGLGIAVAELGTEAALAAMKAVPDVVCPEPEGPRGIDLSGAWTFRVTCLLGASTGTIRYTWTGGNSYRATAVNNRGQRSTNYVTVSGRNLSGTAILSDGTRVGFSGVLAADGRSYSGRNATGCTFRTTR